MAEFSIEPCFRVKIDQEPGDDTAHAFLTWCIKKKIFGPRGGSTGPSGHIGYYYPEFEKQIREWFRKREVKEVEAP